MNKFLILAGACAICSITPAAAAPGQNDHDGQGKDKPGQNDRNNSAKVEQKQSDHGSKRDNGPQKGGADRRDDHKMVNTPRKEGRDQAHTRQEQRQVRNQSHAPDRRPQQATPSQMVRSDGDNNRRQSARKWAKPEDARRFYATYDQERNRSPGGFCPPGLARKNNGCQAPGQARKLYRRDDRWGRYMAYEPRYRSGDWSYYNGYAYSNSHGMNFIPLIGGALFIGQRWPIYYDRYEVPGYYSNYYGYHNDYRYYYTDRTIFGVDRETLAIMGIAALLTGNDFIIGRRMPMGYDVYNVPYAYRDRYYDSDDAHYRYSDGYIYRIDPRTQLVVVSIELDL